VSVAGAAGRHHARRSGARLTTPAARESGFAATLAAARSGDAAAWSTLYHSIAPVLVGYLRAQRLPDPEDVAGEVLLEVVRGLDRFEGDERGFRSWVLAIAHHRLIDARRRHARRPVDPVPTADLEPQPSDADPEAETIAHLGLGELEPALSKLTEEQRAVLLLRVVGDLSIRDVAAVLGKRPGAIKQLQRRSVDAMRRAMDVAVDDDGNVPDVRPATTPPVGRVTGGQIDAHGSGGTQP
jgi:RNA polymerase sigma factor (sigma-70 family)